MLRISKLTDYGVILTTHLVGATGPTAVRDLAIETAIPEPTVRKVLKTLVRSGVVNSTRGARGGYALARSPDAISIAEVITALEGPIAVTECTDESADSSCAHATHCGVRGNWQRINAAVLHALRAITLAEMAGPNLHLVPLYRSREAAS
ncbi:MAG: SUF system Fe-S cluster assembly regulator [Myxococcota bacterium]